MPSPPSVSIRTMMPSDIAAALQLCRSAGWNQLESDWRRLLTYQPNGCFVAVAGNSLVGTVTSTTYATDLGWIGMMLVDGKFRRMGIATRLIERAIQYLQDEHVASIKLDATPVGQKVYERLGFHVEWSFHRWARPASAGLQHSPPQSRQETLSARSLQLDRRAFGTDRGNWLRLVAADSTLRQTDGGYGMLRQGFLASYLGPVVAESADEGRRIIETLTQSVEGIVYWDIPSPNGPAVEIARELRFEPVRDLTRMWHSQCLTPELQHQYAMVDPGTG